MIRKSKDLFDNNIVLVEMPKFYNGWIGQYNVITKEVTLNPKWVEASLDHKLDEYIKLSIKKSM